MFSDRQHAGLLLAQKLSSYKHFIPCVMGLARGGMVVASAIASSLRIPLDVLVVKKLGSPGDSELAIGAVAPDGVSYIDEALAQVTGADPAYITSQTTYLQDQIREKTMVYRRKKKPLLVTNRTVILADDGAATGATMFAAVTWAKRQHAASIIVALPVAPPDVVDKLHSLSADVVVLETASDFHAVGEFYDRFPQITDEEVVQLLS